MLKSKKGSAVADPIFLIVMFFVIAGVLILGGFLFTLLNPTLDGLSDKQEVTDVLTETNQTLNMLDYVMLIVYVGFIFTLVASVFLLDTNPLFYVVIFLMLIIVLVGSPVLSNVYEAGFVNSGMLGDTATNYPITTAIMEYLPLLVLLLMVIYGIAIYAKERV